MSTSDQLNGDVSPITEIIFVVPVNMGISLYILHFMITAPDPTWKYSSVPEMDDIAEIGQPITGYEKRQQDERARRCDPGRRCVYFDGAYERGNEAAFLELADLDVNMFSQ